MKKLQVPYNVDLNVLDLYEAGNDYISEIYLPLHPSIFPSARQNQYPSKEEYDNQLLEIFNRMNKNKIKTMILLNGTKVNYTNDFLEKLYKELKKGIDYGLTGVVIADPILMEWTHFNFPELKIRASILSGYSSLEKLKELEKIKYISEICLQQDINRNEEKIKLLKENTSFHFSTIVNSACRINCPIYYWHQNAYNSNCSGNAENSSELKASMIDLSNKYTQNFLKAPFILPEDLCYWDEYFDQYKLEDRSLPTGRIAEILEYYALRVNPDDIKKCLSGSCIKIESIDCNFPQSGKNHAKNCKGECGKCNLCDEIYKEKILCQK